MATFNITGPDGRKYRISGETPEGALEALKKHIGAQPASADPRNNAAGKTDALLRGAIDSLTLGTSDEIAAGLETGFGFLGDYDKALQGHRDIASADSENRFGYRLGGQVVGGLAGGLGLARGGLSLAGNAVSAGQGLGRVAAGSAADGTILGGLYGAGSGEGVEDRAYQAGVGAITGGATGLAAPFAVAGVTGALRPVVSPVMSRLRPQTYANAALGKGLREAGETPNSVMKALTDARADDQPMYMVGDALGRTGRRMTSTAVRSQNDMSQPLADMLDARQSGQSRRIINALTEAFDAPDTAAQRSTQMTQLRDKAANVNYAAARQNAGPVNVTPVIEEIDKVLTPGVHGMARSNNAIANDSIEGAYSKVRAMLTDGKSNLTDFDALFRAKLDLDDMIQRAEAQGAGNRAHYLGTVQRKLDQSLADASPPYAQARDLFAADSRAIEAIDTGRAAATRGRSQDTIPAFRGMNVDEQYGFRGGYADPLINQAETTAPGINKARPLLNDATQAEFPEFAMPGRGDRLLRQIGREDEMFQTRQRATGGSLTADNLADMADMAQFDPGVAERLLQGKPIAAVIAGITKALKGENMPSTVLSRVARTLMETDPTAARDMLEAAARKQLGNESTRKSAIAILNALGASEPGSVTRRPIEGFVATGR